MKRVSAGCVALLLALLTAMPAHTRDYVQGQLTIVHPWARPTPPGVRVGALYFGIKNSGSKADRLIGYSAKIAGRTELHETRMEGDMARMRPVAALTIPAKGRVKAEPGGLHMMLIDLQQPLKVGDRFAVTLKFERAGSIDVEAVVEDTKKSASHDHSHH